MAETDPIVVRAIEARGFRNLRELELGVGDGITLVHGPNGAGKSNLLEALYFGLTGGSWRASSDRELIAFGEELTRVEVQVEGGGEVHRFLASLVSGEGKRHRVDGAPAAPAHAPLRPPIGVFSPDRLALVKGPPSARRAHLDRFVAALWPARADGRRRYGRALAQRNALLGRVRAGAASEASLEAWERELAAQAIALMEARREAAALLAGPFEESASTLGLQGPAELRYAPRSGARDPAELAAELAERRAADRERGFTTHGPHLDEVEITLAERSLRRYGSQGEQRTALLALLFGERAVLLEQRGTPPLMLLDDVMSELDPGRRVLLIERLAGAGQSLLTATEPSQVPSDCDRVEVAVRAGRFEAAVAA